MEAQSTDTFVLRGRSGTPRTRTLPQAPTLPFSSIEACAGCLMCTGKGAVQAQSGERSIRGSVESFTEPAMYKAFFHIILFAF